jgi:two-component system response regulator AtoC
MTTAEQQKRRILVVDDSEGIRGYLANLLEMRGYDVDTVEDGRRALALLEGGAAPDVILLDVMMPGPDGLESLRAIREIDPDVPVVMLSVVGNAESIVAAMQHGASDYLNKPFEEEELDATLRKVLEKKELEEERERLLATFEEPGAGVVWRGSAMQAIQGTIEQIANTDVTVLIQGESGVGKEIVAREIHERSSRAAGEFVKVNCAALPEQLLESELFGYEKGAFTGAFARKQGKFEHANGGTMFLDEIGEMSPGLQAKLLQVLQDREFSRLGGHDVISVDVRVVCATHRPLEEMVRDRRFREDLYFRLNVVNIRIPPLRERREEIAELADSFLQRYAVKYGRPTPVPSEELSRALLAHDYPGNVRELENLMKRVVVLESESAVLADLRRDASAGRDARLSFQELFEELDATAGEVPLREVGRRASLEAERETIAMTLERTRWNRKQAARMLNVSYKTLLQKIRETGLREPL